MRERIVAAAIRRGQLVISLPPPGRHHLLVQAWHGLTGVHVQPDDQGFLTSEGRFAGREEAWGIAEAAGQIVRRVGGDGARLFSENLW